MVPGNEQIAVLNLHARNDNVVPPGGGQSSDGWFFESVNTLMAQWGSYNSCSGALPPYCSSASPHKLQLQSTRSKTFCLTTRLLWPQC